MYPSTGGFGGGGFTHPGQQPQGEKGIERRFIGKIRKAYFSGEVIFGGQSPKKMEFELSSSMVQILIASANHLFLFTI